MDIYFVTKNKHKFINAQRVLSKYNITVHQLQEDKFEPKEWDIEKVAMHNAKEFANKINKPVIVDDTGIFFEAFQGFPGQLAKWVFEKIDYEGIFQLLKDESRKATFKCAIAFSNSENEKLFNGELSGEISKEIKNPEKDTLPYNKIFIPEGHNLTLAEMDETELLPILHRTKAFEKLGADVGETK
jgi:XTP/dITP diphosphohydrolase